MAVHRLGVAWPGLKATPVVVMEGGSFRLVAVKGFENKIEIHSEGLTTNATGESSFVGADDEYLRIDPLQLLAGAFVLEAVQTANYPKVQPGPRYEPVDDENLTPEV